MIRKLLIATLSAGTVFAFTTGGVANGQEFDPCEVPDTDNTDCDNPVPEENVRVFVLPNGKTIIKEFNQLPMPAPAVPEGPKSLPMPVPFVGRKGVPFIQPNFTFLPPGVVFLPPPMP